ncbi:MAG: 23S rRNA pseudouridine(955/2504/2580) synthase RluC [Kangiellaceae bacterium]|nr:23S rRNA pseudouridine(955/2504/2580) synthase RluC [Kangiellaceae bacterium]
MTSFDKAQFWTIDSEHQGQRIDNYLITHLKGVPKSRVYRIIRKGEIRVNKGRVKAVYKLQSGDIIRIPPIRVSEKIDNPDIVNFKQVKQLENSIILETKQFLVINKPSGIAVHGGSGLSFGLIEGLRALRPKEKFLELVHRLDRDTSGCILIAKRRSFLVHFQNQLRHRKMNKEYLAIVSGQWPKDKTRVDVPLLKTERKSGERIVLVDTSGKASETRFFIEEELGQFTLVVAKPVTGRTHQIRVHARHCFCPLLGDEKYSEIEQDKNIINKLKIKTFMLHARRLSFTLPQTEELVTVEAPTPAKMNSVLKQLRTINN